MTNERHSGLGNHPIVVITGLVASLSTIFVFLTGKPSLPEAINSKPNGTALSSTRVSPDDYLERERAVRIPTSATPSSASYSPENKAGFSATADPITGTLASVNLSKREMILKAPDGLLYLLNDVPRELRMDQMKIGQQVTVSGAKVVPFDIGRK